MICGRKGTTGQLAVRIVMVRQRHIWKQEPLSPWIPHENSVDYAMPSLFPDPVISPKWI
jgi:hypothetical protein